MKRRLMVCIFTCLLFQGFINTAVTRGGLDDFFSGIKESLGISEDQSSNKIAMGLKEALHIGTENAVENVSQIGGYLENPKIKIPLPPAVQKVERILKTVGYGPQVDAFVLSMNRAAEQAAPEAKSIFWNAIKQITFSDASKILKGKDNEATLYFKDKTSDHLRDIFKPIVHNSMSKFGVTRKYQEIDKKVQSLPFAEMFSFDLDEYVTKGALEGLFYMISEEERKIRKDPAARVTKLLKEVFGQ